MEEQAKSYGRDMHTHAAQYYFLESAICGNYMRVLR